MSGKQSAKYGLILLTGLIIGILSFRFSGNDDQNTAPTLAVERADAGDQSSNGHASVSAEIQDWCSEHRVPESECTNCHPELQEKFRVAGDWCTEHGLPESHCRLCNPDLIFPQELSKPLELDLSKEISVFFPPNVSRCATDQAVIQFANAETKDRVGLSVVPAIESMTSAAIEAPAEVVFDATKSTAVTSTVPISIARWLVEPGQAVQRGEIIAEAEAPEIAGLKAEFIEATAQLEASSKNMLRQEELRKKQLISQAEFDASAADRDVLKAHLAGIEGMLVAAGLSSDDLIDTREHNLITGRFKLRSPASGLVVERNAPLGELTSAGTLLALVSDPGALWIEAQVGEHDLARIKTGDRMEFALDGRAISRSGGEVIWVSSSLDASTRRAIVRAKLLEAPDDLRAKQFGRAFIYPESEAQAVMVPRDAIQWEGCCNVVFVKESDYRYRPRKVRLERGELDYYRVTDGLKAGELVVVDGSFLLKTELKKSSIGAGCCDFASR